MENVDKHLMGRHDQSSHARGAHRGLGQTPPVGDDFRRDKTLDLMKERRGKKKDIKERRKAGELSREEFQAELAELRQSNLAQEVNRRKTRLTANAYSNIIGGVRGDAAEQNLKIAQSQARNSHAGQKWQEAQRKKAELEAAAANPFQKSDEVEKHQLGRHDQKNHGKGTKKEHSREQHGDETKDEMDIIPHLSTAESIALTSGILAAAGLSARDDTIKANRKVARHNLLGGHKPEDILRQDPGQVKWATKRTTRETVRDAPKLVKGKLPKPAPKKPKLGVKVLEVQRMNGEDIPALLSGLSKRLEEDGITDDDFREFTKHLLGRHEQDDHNPNRKRNPRLAEAKVGHRRKDHRTKEQAERHKAKGRRITRAIRDVTGMGAAAFIGMTVAGLANGKDLDVAAADASVPYKNVARGIKNTVTKADVADVTVAGEFSKFDDDKRVAFGWASITDIDGAPVVDRQGDVIKIDDLEDAAYAYVLESRVGGEMHRKEIQKGVKFGPKKVATLVESMVFTPEKVEKMGLPVGAIPNGWWVGFKVEDEAVWGKVKKGDYAGFSIHGMGKRVAKSMEEIGKADEEITVEEIQAFAKALYQAGYTSEVLKHLIGSHDQGRHSRKQHGGNKSATAGAAAGATLGAGKTMLDSVVNSVNGVDTDYDAEDFRMPTGTGNVLGGALLGGLAGKAITAQIRGRQADKKLAGYQPKPQHRSGLDDPEIQELMNLEAEEMQLTPEERAHYLQSGGAPRSEAERQDWLKRSREGQERFNSQFGKHLIGSHDQAKHSRKQHGTSKDTNRISDKGRAGRAAAGLVTPLPIGVPLLTSAARGTSVFDTKRSRIKAKQEEKRRKAGVSKAERRAVVLSNLEREFGKADVSALEALAYDIAVAKAEGRLGRELDFPVQDFLYELVEADKVVEKSADAAYTELNGQWAPFEKYLVELSKAITDEDEERVEDLLNLL